MSYPAQVNEAADLAEQLHAQMFGTDDQAVDDPQDDTTPDDNQPDDTTDDLAAELEELRKYKDRYLTLKGKYDSEVPTLQNEFKEFKQSVFEKLEATRQAQPTQDEPQDEFAQFKEEYGEELLNTFIKIADKRAEEKFKSSLKPVEDKVASVEDAQLIVARRNFEDYLSQNVKGNWKQLWESEDPKFVEFLGKEDPTGLYTYGQLVDTCNKNWDADRLGKILNLYFDNSQASIPTHKPPRPDKTAMVAPNRTTSHSVPNTSDKRIWTQDTMKEFQNKDMKNQYTPEESQSLWADLLAAASEGRIR